MLENDVKQQRQQYKEYQKQEKCQKSYLKLTSFS